MYDQIKKDTTVGGEKLDKVLWCAILNPTYYL